MTKQQVEQKTRQLIRESAKHMRANIKRALNSGAIDISSYDDDFLLPKIIFQALLKEEQHQYKCHSDKDKHNKTIDNIYLML